MRNDLRCVVLCSLWMLLGMRDPFRPPDDRCAIGQLAQWRYQGRVSNLNAVGLVQDERHRWLRVRPQMRFPAGWRVLSVNENELIVEVGEGCEPKEWRWQRKGTMHEKNTDSRPAADSQSSDIGSRAKTRLADGG